MTRRYARAPKGERAYGSVPRNRGKNTTLLASMSSSGMGGVMAVEGATTKVIIEAYVEGVLAPTLWAGQVVVLDNLGAHKGERVRELIESRGCSLLFVPPYSPDFSPIEEAFSKVKALLKKAAAARRSSKRSRERWGRSRHETLRAGSPIVAMGFPLNHHENRCQTVHRLLTPVPPVGRPAWQPGSAVSPGARSTACPPAMPARTAPSATGRPPRSSSL